MRLALWIDHLPVATLPNRKAHRYAQCREPSPARGMVKLLAEVGRRYAQGERR